MFNTPTREYNFQKLWKTEKESLAHFFLTLLIQIKLTGFPMSKSGTFCLQAQDKKNPRSAILNFRAMNYTGLANVPKACRLKTP